MEKELIIHKVRKILAKNKKRVLKKMTLEDMAKLIKQCEPESKFKVGKKIKVNDRMQKGYEYTLSEPIGKNFDPDFKPELSPKQMLEAGVFEGQYCNDCIFEFPREWFEGAIKKKKLKPEYPDPKEINKFEIKSRQSLYIWKQNGWLYGDDVRGWFQWYMRYYLGRRDPEVDQKQISRWNSFKRHVGQIKANCKPGDKSCRPKQRQALLQWSYNPDI
jgi:hypothetical protein